MTCLLTLGCASLAWALTSVPTATAGCTINLGDCDPNGNCAVNLDQCGSGGGCEVNLGNCTADCTLNTGTCKPQTGFIASPVQSLPVTHRCAYMTAGDSSQGVFGYTLAVTPGAPFTLRAIDIARQRQDLDVVFYRELTPCGQDAAVVGEPYVNGPADERGTVPADATVAIVYLFTGANANFEYAEVAG